MDKKLFEEVFNEHNKELLEESNSTSELVLKLGVGVAVLAIAFGVKIAKNNVADQALKKLGSLDNYKKFNTDNNGTLGKIVGFSDTQSKAMYASIVGLAREEGISIDKAANRITEKWSNTLKQKFKDKNSLLNFNGRVTAVSVTTSPDTGERLVRVDSEWTEKHSSGSGSNKHYYHVRRTGTVFIPMSEGNMYGMDDDGSSVKIGGYTFTLNERKLLHKFYGIFFG